MLGVEKGGPSRMLGGIVTLLGECDDPDRTAVRKRLSDLGVPFKPDWPLVDGYQAQLIAAMRSGDWSAFGAAPAVPAAASRRVTPPASTDPR